MTEIQESLQETELQDSITRTVEVEAPLERVWRAISDHEQFGAWFRVALDGPFLEGEIQTGKVIYPGYEHLIWRILVVAVEPLKRLAFRWSPYNDVTEPDGPTTLVEMKLEETATGTRVTFVESGFGALPNDGRRLETFRLNSGGWDEQCQNIVAYVAR